MSERKPILISGLQAAQWGPLTFDLAKDIIRNVTEESTGKPHEWRTRINIDAIELVPVSEAGA